MHGAGNVARAGYRQQDHTSVDDRTAGIRVLESQECCSGDNNSKRRSVDRSDLNSPDVAFCNVTGCYATR